MSSPNPWYLWQNDHANLGIQIRLEQTSVGANTLQHYAMIKIFQTYEISTLLHCFGVHWFMLRPSFARCHTSSMFLKVSSRFPLSTSASSVSSGCWQSAGHRLTSFSSNATRAIFRVVASLSETYVLFGESNSQEYWGQVSWNERHIFLLPFNWTFHSHQITFSVKMLLVLLPSPAKRFDRLCSPPFDNFLHANIIDWAASTCNKR